MKDETLEQIKEFTETLDRLNKGDVTLNSKISSMRNVCTTLIPIDWVEMRERKIDENCYYRFNSIGDKKSDCQLF